MKTYVTSETQFGSMRKERGMILELTINDRL